MSKSINFQALAEKLRAIDTAADAKVSAVVTRDTEFQAQVAARGGTMTSSLTEGAEQAAAAVMRQRDKARAELADPVRRDGVAEQARLAAKAEAAALEYLSVSDELARHERALVGFLHSAGQQAIPTFADGDAAAFLDRVQRHRAQQVAAAARPVSRPPLTAPVFADLVR